MLRRGVYHNDSWVPYNKALETTHNALLFKLLNYVLMKLISLIIYMGYNVVIIPYTQ